MRRWAAPGAIPWLLALAVSGARADVPLPSTEADATKGDAPQLWPEAGAESSPARDRRKDIVRLGVKANYGDESTPFSRESLRLRVETEHPETLFRIEAALARYEDEGDELTRGTLGLLMRQLLPGEIVVRGDARFFFMGSNPPTDDVGIEYGVEFQTRIASVDLELRLGARRRSLLDAPPGWEPVAALYDQGYGGSTVGSLRQRVMLTEGTAGLSWSPIRGSWSYVNLALGIIDDNVRRTINAGAGLDLIAGFGVASRWSLTVLYGLDDLANSQTSSSYWSPSHELVHHSGVDVRWSDRGEQVYGAEAALTFGADLPIGYFVGAFVRQPLPAGWWLEGRFRASDNGIFRVLNSSVGFGVEL